MAQAFKQDVMQSGCSKDLTHRIVSNNEALILSSVSTGRRNPTAPMMATEATTESFSR